MFDQIRCELAVLNRKFSRRGDRRVYCIEVLRADPLAVLPARTISEIRTSALRVPSPKRMVLAMISPRDSAYSEVVEGESNGRLRLLSMDRNEVEITEATATEGDPLAVRREPGASTSPVELVGGDVGALRSPVTREMRTRCTGSVELGCSATSPCNGHPETSRARGRTR